MAPMASDGSVSSPVFPGVPPRWAGSVPQQLPLSVLAEVAVAPGSLPSLAQALAAVPEHRRPRGFKAQQPPYPLVPLLLLLIVGVLSGRRGYASIAWWAQRCSSDHPEVLDALGFAPGRRPRSPATRTLFRLVRDLQARAFQTALQNWLAATAAALQITLPARERARVPEDQVIVDGKTVRGAAARRSGAVGDPTAGLHLVAAFVPALTTVWDQLATEGKGQEIAAAQMLLGTLPLRGRLITADALHTQREFCQTILEREGDYLLPVKDNQPALLADLQEAFSPSASGGAVGPAAPRSGGAATPPASDAPGCAGSDRPGALPQGPPRAAGGAHPLDD